MTSIFPSVHILQQNHYAVSTEAAPPQTQPQQLSLSNGYLSNSNNRPEFNSKPVLAPTNLYHSNDNVDSNSEESSSNNEPKQSLENEIPSHKVAPAFPPRANTYLVLTTANPLLQPQPHSSESIDSILPTKIAATNILHFKNNNKPKLRLNVFGNQRNKYTNVLRPTLNSDQQQYFPNNPLGLRLKATAQPIPNPSSTSVLRKSPNSSGPKFVYIKEVFGKKIAPTTSINNNNENSKHILSSQSNHLSNSNELEEVSTIPPRYAITPTTTTAADTKTSEIQSNNDSGEIAAISDGGADSSDARSSNKYHKQAHDINELPDIRTSSLAEILHKLQESNHLPQTLTPDNIDNSIKTLIRILNNLKRTQSIVSNPSQYYEQDENVGDDDKSRDPGRQQQQYEYDQQQINPNQGGDHQHSTFYPDANHQTLANKGVISKLKILRP